MNTVETFDRRAGRVAALVALLLATACGAQPEAGGSQQTGAGAAPPAASQLPPDHPPVASSPPKMAIVPPPSGAGTGSGSLVWTVPAGWVAETPSSGMRRAQYRVSGAEGEAECVVFYFGPGQGGDAFSNARRWADQFSQPDGRPSRDLLKTSQTEVNGIPVLMAEISGTYAGGMAMMGPAEEHAGYMLLGAVAEGPDANWFFKLTGPEALVERSRGAFEGMIRSLQRGS